MNTKDFKVRWFYSEDRKTTTCRIFNQQEQLLAEASINRYVKDPFIKDIARRNSMQKAINAGNKDVNNLTFDKPARTMIWNGYKDMRPVSKWIKLNH